MAAGSLVRDLMTREVVTLGRNDKLTIADDVMKLGRIRHLPVMDDEGEVVVGVVSQRDLFRGALARSLGYGERAQQKLLAQLVVKEIMSAEVETIGPDAGDSSHARAQDRLPGRGGGRSARGDPDRG